MSQDTGLFSVRRPREVSATASTVRSEAQLTEINSDARRHQLQLCHTTTCLRDQALELHIEHQGASFDGPSHLPSWPLNLIIANVTRAQSPPATILPALLFRHKSRRFRPAFYCSTEFFRQHLRQCGLCSSNELCTSNDAARTTANERIPKYAKAEQRLLSSVFDRTR